MTTKAGIGDDPDLHMEAKRQAAQLLKQLQEEVKTMDWRVKPQALPAAVALLGASREVQLHGLLGMLMRESLDWRLAPVLNILVSRDLPWWAEEIEALMERAVVASYWSGEWGTMLDILDRFKAQGNTLSPTLVAGLRIIESGLKNVPGSEPFRLQRMVAKLLGEDLEILPDAGEAWADLARADIAALPPEQQSAWKRLFAQMQIVDGSKPPTAWRKQAKAHLTAVGEDSFRQRTARWFASVTVPVMRNVQYEDRGRIWEHPLSHGTERNINILKGLAWLCAETPGVETARALARLVEACLRKQPGVGPWAVRAALAALWTLTESDSPEAVSQLGRLKMKVSFRTALNAIEKGLEIVAKRVGVTKADLEDLSVPTYGFPLDGIRRETFGDCAAVATISPTGEISVAWYGPNDKPVKTVPAAVKKEFAVELKEFKAEVEAAGKMLTAQKTRFDGFYLPERVWSYGTWKDRFLTHSLLSVLTRRLIWHFSEPNGGRKTQGIWNEANSAFVDVQGAAIDWLTDETEVRLWHPIGFSVDAVVAWRNYLQSAEIVQPFKQAYREVYLLTDAELNTGAYSNRFAGHILKQHQMNSLAALRGWKNKLRLMVDDVYPPASKELPELGLRAEFWIEGIGENYGEDTTESGSYLYLTTDQVRFYPLNAAENYAHAGGGGYASGHWGANRVPTPSLPLTEVPALAFSEVMRDVDLFVGVSSVGNDPNWQDGGPQGQYQTYWNSYSFGALSATAQTRHEVLARLLPRLKIASRCSLTERFLVVRGDLRTYKIHLGSSNILMEPNDQYLCIVQDRGVGSAETPVNFLPFEGDSRLALILSKAFLLAEDSKINDISITRQIRR